jgi:1-acyl-sn-glycerol-3-phosphate acyltransferase
MSGTPGSGFAKALLKLAGWRLTGLAPEVPRCLVIFAPHTSNWDFVILLLVRAAFHRRVSFLAKHTLFRPPFGWLFRALDGIPVQRSEQRHMVQVIASEFTTRERLWLCMAPEGTRKKTDHWRSGFYYIALEAEVPIVCAFVDSKTRECGLGALIELSGDVDRDLAAIRAFYADKRGLYPDQASDIEFQRRD